MKGYLLMEKHLPSHFHSRQEQLHLLNLTKTQQLLLQDGKWCLVLNTYLIDWLKYLLYNNTSLQRALKIPSDIIIKFKEGVPKDILFFAIIP